MSQIFMLIMANLYQLSIMSAFFNYLRALDWIINIGYIVQGSHFVDIEALQNKVIKSRAWPLLGFSLILGFGS